MITARPHLSSPKPFGMLDAVKKGRFVDYLANKYPENIEEKLDRQNENECDDIIYNNSQQ